MIMTFVNGIFSLLGNGISFIGDMIWKVVEFIAKPLSYLFYFLEGIFHLFYVLFTLVVKVITLCVALFQFIGSIVAGVIRTIMMWLSFTPNTSQTSFPSVSQTGFAVIYDLANSIGLLSVVPLLALAFVWFFFALRVLNLLGVKGSVSNAKYDD